MTRLLICGSRTWTDSRAIDRVLKRYDPRDTIIIHGDHWEGADRIADAAAAKRGFQRIKFPAAWAGHLKRRAGPVRNQLMLDICRPDQAIAFRSLGKSDGTDDMVERCRAAGLFVEVIDGVDQPWAHRPRA